MFLGGAVPAVRAKPASPSISSTIAGAYGDWREVAITVLLDRYVSATGDPKRVSALHRTRAGLDSDDPIVGVITTAVGASGSNWAGLVPAPNGGGGYPAGVPHSAGALPRMPSSIAQWG